MRVWLARDNNGDLSFYDKKPKRMKNFFLPSSRKMESLSWFVLPKDEFPEVTWENSPQEYELEYKLTFVKKGGKDD